MDLCESPTQVHPASRLAVLAGVIMLIYKKHGSIYWINSGKGRSGNPAQKLKADQDSGPFTYWLPLDCISPSLSLSLFPQVGLLERLNHQGLSVFSLHQALLRTLLYLAAFSRPLLLS